MNARADWGGVSRPSSQAWIATGSSCRWPSMIPAVTCWSSACTPPFPIRPSRWSVPPRRRTLPHNSATAGSRKNAPDSIAWEMRTMSWGTTRPAPRFRCPTSLLPICPSGRPTASPDASSNVRGALAQRRCQVGVSPSSTAFPSRPGRNPQPSSTMRTTGVRGPCLFAILEGMQSSRALRALPVVLWLAPTPPLIAQARYRVTTDGAWFYQEAGGKRLARLARGAVVSGGDQQGDWQGVTLEGWIFTTSVGPLAPRIRPPHGAVPRARRSPRGHLGACGAAARAGALGGVDARPTRGLGEDRRPPQRAPRRAGGRVRRRAARRSAPLRGATSPLDARVHLAAEGGRAAARDPHRGDVHAGPRAAPRARLRVRDRPRGETGAARGAHPPRRHRGHGAGAGGAEPVPRQPGRRPHQLRGLPPAMNEILRERLLRKLETLPDDKAYLVLDYVEFLESKYAERPAGAAPFQRVAETLEDTLRAGRVPVNIIKGTMDAVGKAGKLLERVAAAGKAAVEEAQKKNEDKGKVEEPPPSQ